ATGIEDVLEIRLYLTPASKLVAVSEFQQRFARADRKGLAGKAGDIGIEIAGCLADPRVADRQPQLVVLAAERPVIGDPGISIEADQVAVVRCPHYPREHYEALLGAFPEERLIND